MSNDLITNFIFNDRDGAKLDARTRNLEETGKKFDQLGANANFGEKMSREFGKAESAGANSLNRLKNLTKDIDNALSKPFSESYKSAFSDIENRSRKLGESFQKLSQTKIEKGQFDLISQGAVVGERRVTELSNRIVRLKKEAADPANAQFGKYYADGIREAEKELARFERKFASLKRDQRNSGSGGLPGSGDSFSGGFSNRVFGQYSGMTGGAILGGIAAGATLAGINAVTGAVSTLTDKAADLTVQSVKLAANFEESTNSLAIFAGGTYNARRELAALDDIALKTPGLKLEDAEKGYQRLRALNFQAGIAKDLIRGLGIARTQSGADSSAVDRVITNLTQLTSGSGTAADVRQTIQAIPSLRGTFQRAFGTSEFGEINKLAKSNPDEFIKKFSAELSKAETAQVGLNIAIEKGSDALTQAGRTFGEPILQPLTRDVLSLTKTLNENGNTIKKWGQNFADVYNGLSTLITENPQVIKFLSFQARNALAASTFGLSETFVPVFEGLRKIGADRRAAEGANPGAEGFAGFDFQKEQEKVEKEKDLLKKRQNLIELQKQIDSSQIENNLNYSKAVAASRFGGIRLIEETTRLEIDALRRQVQANEEFARAATANLSSEDFDKGKGLEISRKNALDNAKLQNQIAVLQITSQKQIADEIKNTEKKIKDLNKAYSEVFANLAQRTNTDNPFVSVFTEARSELEKLKESIKGLPADLQAAAVASQQRLNSNKLFSARLDNDLSAFDLRETARKFRGAGSDESYKKLFEDAVRSDVSRGGFFPNLGGTYGSFSANKAGGFDKLTDAQKRDIYEVNQLKNLSTYDESNFSTNDRSLISRLARERMNSENGANLSVSERLQKQLGIINSGVTNADQRNLADAKILSLAANLDPSQISQNEREQVAAAAERRAERQENALIEALKIDREQLGYQKLIAENGAALLAVARDKGLNGLNDYLEITLKDQATGGAAITGSSGTQEDVKNTYFNEANF